MNTTPKHIRQMQLAAAKAGMIRASEVLYEAWHNQNKSPRQCEHAILDAAKKLSLEDLRKMKFPRGISLRGQQETNTRYETQ